MAMPKNPYGGVPGGGVTLPDYFTPTPNLASNNNYFPTSEQLGSSRAGFGAFSPFPTGEPGNFPALASAMPHPCSDSWRCGDPCRKIPIFPSNPTSVPVSAYH